MTAPNSPGSASGLPISARDFRAVGNGTTDDTAALQAAINAAIATRRALIIPAGDYSTGPLTIALTTDPAINGFEMFGEGRGATRLVRRDNDSRALLTVSDTEIPQTVSTVFRNFTVEGFGVNFGTGIQLRHVASVSILHVFVYNCMIGIDCFGGNSNELEMGYIGNCGTGVLIRKFNAGVSYPNAISIRRMKISDCPTQRLTSTMAQIS